MSNTGKTAIVTGGARGIGRASALALAGKGFDVAIMDRRQPEGADTIKALQALGVEALQLVGEVSEFDTVQRLGTQVIDEWGRIDVLVNNAGISQPKGILEISEAEWDHTLAVDLKGYFNWCHFVAPLMTAQESGRIVNISSVSAHTGGSPTGVSKFAYAAAKGGVLGMTRALAKELAPHVTVNAICPGAVFTDLTREHFTPLKEAIVGAIPLGRMGTPEDIAEVVAFLASVEPNFLTGEVVDVTAASGSTDGVSAGRSGLQRGHHVAGRLAPTGRPQHVAGLGRVEIAERHVHCRAIVPANEIADLPIVTVDVFGPSCVAAEKLDDGRAFRPGHPVEMRRALADVERFFPAVRMDTDTGMGDRRVEFQQFGYLHGVALRRTRDQVEIVDRLQVVDDALHLVGQFVIGPYHVAEHGIAADRWFLRAIEHRDGGGPTGIGIIRMPVPAGKAGLRRLAVLRLVGDFKEFGMARQPVMRGRGMIVQLA